MGMNMKKLADEAMNELNNRMEGMCSSLHPSGDEILMAAMTCRIGELEEALSGIQEAIDVISCLRDYDLSDEDCAIESTIVETIRDVLSN